MTLTKSIGAYHTIFDTEFYGCWDAQSWKLCISANAELIISGRLMVSLKLFLYSDMIVTA